MSDEDHNHAASGRRYGGHAGLVGRAFVRNEAKLRFAPWHGHPARASRAWAGWGPQTRSIAFGSPYPCHFNTSRRHCQRGCCAKQSQFRGLPADSRGAIAPNKPNSTGMACEVSALEKESYGESYAPGAANKQSQLAVAGSRLEKELRQTNPICPSRRLCETKPI
jgi:hypothetical protein